jgi:hypothetical protein
MSVQVRRADTGQRGFRVKFLKAALATALFITLLIAIYWAHVRFFRVNVLLYSALADGVIATAVGAALLYGTSYWAEFNRFEKAQMCLIWLLGGCLFAIAVPTVIDRSLSFYILEKLQQRGGGIRLDRFEDVFTHEYMQEHHLVQIRLTEQQESGTITIENGCVKLTERGARVARFSRFFRKYLLPTQRLIGGEYSDALVDPFRKSEPVEDYTCG